MPQLFCVPIYRFVKLVESLKSLKKGGDFWLITGMKENSKQAGGLYIKKTL